MSHWVYMLRCRDASYYTGIAEDVEFRVAQHNEGKIEGYTQTRLPVRVVYTEEYATRLEAFRRERQIKGWSRAKKEALVSGNWDRLRFLSRSYIETASTSSVVRASSARGPSTGSG